MSRQPEAPELLKAPDPEAVERFFVVGIGELLWDLFPSGERLGGAPANFAYMTSLLGDDAVIASRVGADLLGDRARNRLGQSELETSHLQIDPYHATGTVQVELDRQGKPAFTIAEEVAWDYLEWTAEWQEAAARADAVCFGTLAQRSPRSRETIRRFLAATSETALRLCDVNLRKPFYSAAVIGESFAFADVVKLNDEELPVVLALTGLNSGGEEEAGARRLVEAFDLQMVCVTRGDRGSLLVTAEEAVEHSGFTVAIADTVGAGDAFTAALVHHLLRGASPAKMSASANRMGSWVATQVGAMPPADPQVLAEVLLLHDEATG